MNVPSKAFTATLASFVAGVQYDQLDKRVIESARERIIDQLGVQLIGSTMPWSRLIAEYVRDYGGLSESSVVGHDFCVPSHEAAFANATFGHSCELDDYGGGHAGVATIPTAFALAEANRYSGAAVIGAVVTGYEVISRLRGLLHKGLHRRGFHTMGVVGVFGAATTAANLLRLNENQALHALAIAGSFAGTTMEYDQTGGEAKRMHAGLVARGGIQAAILAQRRLTGPTSILEGHRGIGRVFADFDGDWTVALDKLGQEFSIKDVGTKVHPVLARAASSLDAAAILMNGAPIPAQDIAAIYVAVNEGTLKHGGSIRRPKDALSAQMSLPFALAMQLVTGRNELYDYMDAGKRNDPDILSAAEKVQLRADPNATGDKTFSSRLTVKLVSGEELHMVQEFPKGSPSNPLTRDELLGKFRKLSSKVLESRQIEQLIEHLNRLESIEDLSVIRPLIQKTDRN